MHDTDTCIYYSPFTLRFLMTSLFVEYDLVNGGNSVVLKTLWHGVATCYIEVRGLCEIV